MTWTRRLRIMLDAEKTLAPQDTGLMFWQEVSPVGSECPSSANFKIQGCTYASFRQALLLYEERAEEFEDLCDKVATKVEMYPEMTSGSSCSTGLPPLRT
jgi:hypothetical protein